MRFGDGSVRAVQLDGRDMYIDGSFSWEMEEADTDNGMWREWVPTNYGTIEVHLRGRGRLWRDGESYAPRPAAPIDAGPKAIEGASHG